MRKTSPHILTFGIKGVRGVRSLFTPLKTMIFSSQRPRLVRPRLGNQPETRLLGVDKDKAQSQLCVLV